jgi:hypothetical protein
VTADGGLEDVDRATLERSALGNWSPAAEARVASTGVVGRSAVVNLFVNGDYEYSVIFRREEGGDWWESASSSGHMDALDLARLDSD